MRKDRLCGQTGTGGIIRALGLNSGAKRVTEYDVVDKHSQELRITIIRSKYLKRERERSASTVRCSANVKFVKYERLI